ncbi:MAG: tRNA(Met) cytidine acetyltransferase TmcA [Halobacteriales archaeon]
MIDRVAADLRAEAEATGERRMLVLTGSRGACLEAAGTALDATGIGREGALLIGDADLGGVETVPHSEADSLLGATHRAVVFDAHDRLEPNALGRTVGTVDGGGLFVLLAPSLSAWPEQRDGFAETLAVPPAGIADVTGHFRARLVETLRAHPGIAIVDVDAGGVVRDGLTDPAPRLDGGNGIDPPADTTFPAVAYEACLTADQAEAVAALEGLLDPGTALVVEADRGRGKSSAAGIAAAALSREGADVLVTAPAYRSASEVFARAAELLETLEALDGRDDATAPRRIDAAAGGRVRFLSPREAIESDAVTEADVAVVDEAAALPVPVLSSLLDADGVAFTTTVHGYEGAGRGFSVRFRDRLEASDLSVRDVSMADPIRYAAGDPVETWSFRALCLDASPVPEGVAAGARPETVSYRGLDPVDLCENEALLREAFGLLVLAHYRTEPNDLARLLDAPNVSIRALLEDGHVVAVALLAREGGLPETMRADMYEGGRIRGNMLPDVLTSQLGDEAAAAPVGRRVMRITTHAAVRSRGLGSYLLDLIEREARGAVDWLGVGYGATPDLISFWADNDFSTVHLSTTRNDTSGEHSALMLKATSQRGRDLQDRHASAFAERIGSVLGDALSRLDPDIVRGTLRATATPVEADLRETDWRQIARAAFGPGLIDVDPGPFRELALAHLIDPGDPDLLSAREERLLVMKPLQTRGWTAVAGELGYDSRRACARAVGNTYQSLVDAYGSEAAREETARFRGESPDQ